MHGSLAEGRRCLLHFYDFGEYQAFVAAASMIGSTAHLVVLLGGDAGLRAGEMRTREWADINLKKRQICVERKRVGNGPHILRHTFCSHR